MNTFITTAGFPTHSLFDSLFDPLFESVTAPVRRTTFKNTHVSNEDDKYTISVAAPGLDKEDFNITVTDGVLSVSTEKTVTEFGTPSFTKTWTLPDGTIVEGLKADYKQGILRVTVPKPEDVVPKTTTIEVG
jgi:HSP20 family protein